MNRDRRSCAGPVDGTVTKRKAASGHRASVRLENTPDHELTLTRAPDEHLWQRFAAVGIRFASRAPEVVSASLRRGGKAAVIPLSACRAPLQLVSSARDSRQQICPSSSCVLRCVARRSHALDNFRMPNWRPSRAHGEASQGVASDLQAFQSGRSCGPQRRCRGHRVCRFERRCAAPESRRAVRDADQAPGRDLPGERVLRSLLRHLPEGGQHLRSAVHGGQAHPVGATTWPTARAPAAPARC